MQHTISDSATTNSETIYERRYSTVILWKDQKIAILVYTITHVPVVFFGLADVNFRAIELKFCIFFHNFYSINIY